ANMLIFHKLSDLDNVGDAGSAMRSLANSLLANAETRIVYRQESDQLGPSSIPPNWNCSTPARGSPQEWRDDPQTPTPHAAAGTSVAGPLVE
ncbi:MAG: hypothetical protein L0H41_04070, partial [Microlunatus sp.]|nr:hypothetical protein [Microlunatus sp.]